MAVSVQCPGCFSTMQVAEEKLGAKVKCRTCSEVFVARGGGSGKGTGKKQPSRSKKSKKGSSSGSPVGLIAGLAAVLVLGIGAYMVFGRGGAAEGNPAAPGPQATATPAAGTPAGTGTPPGAAAVPTQAAVWNVVDPPRLPLEWTRGLDVKVALPTEESKPIFPALPVPFFATSSGKGFTVFDLRTGMPVKHVAYPASRISTLESLSPDGLYWATAGFVPPKVDPAAPADMRQMFPPTRVAIVSVATGAMTADVELPMDFASANFMEFRSPTELLVMGISKNKGWIGVVLSLDGKVVRPLELPKSIDSGSIHLSAGGRFLLTIATFVQPPNPLAAIDLDTGRSVGTANTHDDVYKSVQLTDLAFSPDGRQIGILQRYEDAFRILVLSAEDGSRLRQVTVPGDSTTILSKRVGGDKGLAWHPDGKHFVLFDGLVIDAETGAVAVDLGNLRADSVDARVLGHQLLKSDWVGDRMVRSTPISLPAAP